MEVDVKTEVEEKPKSKWEIDDDVSSILKRTSCTLGSVN